MTFLRTFLSKHLPLQAVPLLPPLLPEGHHVNCLGGCAKQASSYPIFHIIDAFPLTLYRFKY